MSSSTSQNITRVSPFVFGGMSIYWSYYLSIQTELGWYATTIEAIAGIFGVGLIAFGVAVEFNRVQ